LHIINATEPAGVDEGGAMARHLMLEVLAGAFLVVLAACAAGDPAPQGESNPTSITTVVPATPDDPTWAKVTSSPAAPPETTPPAASETTATPDLGPALISATWSDTNQAEGGRSLAVVPAAWVRDSFSEAALTQLWAEVIAAQPDADTPGMYDQLVCHALGAPHKASWNIEPWRPDVGLPAVIAAACNPG
jgi:hypothetical protein